MLYKSPTGAELNNLEIILRVAFPDFYHFFLMLSSSKRETGSTLNECTSRNIHKSIETNSKYYYPYNKE